MASDHSGERAGDVKATALCEPHGNVPSKLVPPNVPAAPIPVSGNTDPFVFGSTQGNRVILSPLQTTSTASSSSSAPPSATPSSSPLLPVRGAITVPLSSPTPYQSATVYLDSADLDYVHSRQAQPQTTRIGASSRYVIQNGVIADSRNRDHSTSRRAQPCTLDHSYAARQPLTTPPSDTTVDQTASDSSNSCNDGSSGEEWEEGISPSPPVRRGRPPKNATKEHGEDKDGYLSSPPAVVNPRKRWGLGLLKPKKLRGRGRGCGACPSCMRKDCGVCRFCQDKPKFGGPGKKRQRCTERICSNLSAGQNRLLKDLDVSPAERYEPFETATSSKNVTEISQFYRDDVARFLSVVPMEVIQQSQTSSHAERPQSNREGVACVLPMEVIQRPQTSSRTPAISGPSLPAPVKLPAEKVGIGVTAATVNSVEHPVVIATPPQITPPCAKEKPLETAQHSEVKAAEVVVSVCSSPDKEQVEDSVNSGSPAIAEDKTEPAPVVAKVPRTRSQVGREMSQNVPSPTAEKAKALVKQAEGRRRRRWTMGSFGDLKMKCLFCGRQRKLAVARSEKFCTQRCIQQWSEAHPGKDPEASASEEEYASSATRSKKPAKSRELKNLQIDMALPGKGTPHTISHHRSTPRNPLSPVLGPSPRPLTSPAVSISKVALPAKMISSEDTGHTNNAAKRISTPQPEPKKKLCEDDHHSNNTTGNDQNSSTRPTTTMVLPISAPLLMRTVPPPPVSIMHMNQIPSLANALSNLTEPRSHSRGLSSNIQNWSVEQVVQYFEGIQDCWDYIETFREHELDGSALLLLTHESLVKCLGIKLGRALKIMQHVEELRRFQES